MDVFEDNPCGDPEADVAKIWNKAERERVAGGMMQNGGVGAPRTVNAIDESMERLTENYIELRAKFCEAAYVAEEMPEPEYRAKVACLDKNLQRSLTHLDTLAVGESSAAADLALLTSRSEGLSNMILESMAVGLPVLATAAGGNAELVREGETGQLLPSRDPDAIAERVEQLLQNPGLARELGKAGRRRVETDFSLALLAERSIGIYERLIEGA